MIPTRVIRSHYHNSTSLEVNIKWQVTWVVVLQMRIICIVYCCIRNYPKARQLKTTNTVGEESMFGSGLSRGCNQAVGGL